MAFSVVVIFERRLSGVVSGAYAADVSGFRLRGADRAGPREKLYGTRRSRLPPWESAFLLM